MLSVGSHSYSFSIGCCSMALQAMSSVMSCTSLVCEFPLSLLADIISPAAGAYTTAAGSSACTLCPAGMNPSAQRVAVEGYSCCFLRFRDMLFAREGCVGRGRVFVLFAFWYLFFNK